MINTFIDEIEYRKAFKEVYEILKYVSNEDLKKIPSEILIIIKENMQLDYNYKINDICDFQNQEISETAKAILSIIYRDYWATKEEKNNIKIQEFNERNIIEQEKRKKYNPDDIFKKKKAKTNNTTENVQLIKYKENIFIKIINFFKKYF